MTRIAIIVVNYRTAELALDCVQSLIGESRGFAEFRVIVVDGGSGDESVQVLSDGISALKLQNQVEILSLSVNGGFAFANNRAMMLLASRGKLPDYIALINPDTRVRPGSLDAMAEILLHELDAGAVGAQLIHDDGRPQASVFQFPNLLGEFCAGARTGLISRVLRQPMGPFMPTKACVVPWVTGAAVMFRTLALETVGLLDEGFFLYFEETELMWRLYKAGWKIWHQPRAQIIHEGGAATQIRDPETGTQRKIRIPSYWYASRRRYFTLTGGRFYAFLASIFWLCGHGIWCIRRTFTGCADNGPLSPAVDLLHFGFHQPVNIPAAAAPRFSDTPALIPAWMEGAN